MKNRRKLVTDSDNQSVSPGGLLENVEETSKRLQSEHKLGRKNGVNTFNYEPVSNYLISVLEPSQHSTSINRIDLPKADSNSRQSSLKALDHHTLKSMEGGNEERDLVRQLTKLQVRKQKKKSCKLLFQHNNILQGIVRSQKIQNLKKNFIKKIRRTSTCYEPVSLDRLDNSEKQGLLYLKGIEVKPLFESIFNLLSVIQITSLLVIYSVSFVFQDLLSGNYPFVDMIQICSLAFYFLQIVLNFISVKFAAGKKIELIKDIVQNYVRKNFWVDFVSAVILLIDISSKQEVTSYFRMFIIFKMPQCMDKIQKIEVYFIRNVYNEQYWEMAKVFLVNFCYAHVIALFLSAMASFSPDKNWLDAKGITNAPWLQRYVWSYYWATNLMLTVGFGDIVAVNYKQAICIIFIETFSCIIMAYNINRVGSIITNIRQQDMNRSKKYKIFKKLTDQNTIPEELAFKINNYIEESSKIKKRFNYEEDQQFLKELPDNLRVTYLKEANKEVLNKLVFFKSLLDRTLCNFSEYLQTKISHPQEIIRSLDDDFNLIILKKGHIGYICKKNGCNFNDSIADEIQVKSNDLPFLTSLDFISKIRPHYEIKSLEFSVLFTLDYGTFIEIFRRSDMDYELFCFLRDKCRNIPDQFEVMPCQFCKNYNHFKFTCPRLHYVPYEQHTIDKYIYQEQTGRNDREYMYRHKPKSFKPMEYYKKVKGYREDMVKGRTRSTFSRQQESLHFQSTLGYIKSMQMDEPVSENKVRTATTIERMFDQRAREVIQIQLLKRQKIQNFYDQIWIINLDVMTNYNSYFSQDNPKYLEEKFSKEARMASKKLRFNNRARGSISQAEDKIEVMVEQYKIRAMVSNIQEFEDHVEEIE